MVVVAEVEHSVWWERCFEELRKHGESLDVGHSGFLGLWSSASEGVGRKPSVCLKKTRGQSPAPGKFEGNYVVLSYDRGKFMALPHQLQTMLPCGLVDWARFSTRAFRARFLPERDQISVIFWPGTRPDGLVVGAKTAERFNNSGHG